MVFFTELEQVISQFAGKYINLQIAPQTAPKSNLEKKNRIGGINLPDFRIYYKATVIKTGTKTEIYINLEQNWKSRDKSTYLWTPYL